MPDGEIFYAPVEDSPDGHIQFTYPAVKNGTEIPDIFLRYEKGELVEATTSGDQTKLDKLLDTDDGSKTFGEFGIGTNYQIQEFTRNTLFDEKIGGTIHLALGNAYEESLGTNRSAIHVDIVNDLRKGGEMYVDGKLFQKDGKFLFD